jgi:DNA-3-methyladenine glycosylase II
VLGLAEEPVDLHELASLPDGEVKRRLVAVRGIGEWTAEWFLARHLGRPDVWPAGDLGLRHAVSAFLADGRDVSIADARSLGERFSPHRNLAAHYLLTGMRVFRQ